MRNLYNVNGRWKYRRVIPSRLRAEIDGNITEFVRWLGRGSGQPSPEVLRKYAACAAECDNLVTLAEKRVAGRFDELNAETVAHIISTARSELLEEDEEARFDASEDTLFADAGALSRDTSPMAIANHDPDRRWNRRQEDLEASLAGWRHEFRGALFRISSSTKFRTGVPGMGCTLTQVVSAFVASPRRTSLS